MKCSLGLGSESADPSQPISCRLCYAEFPNGAFYHKATHLSTAHPEVWQLRLTMEELDDFFPVLIAKLDTASAS